MKIRFLVLAGLISVMCSVAGAQSFYIISSSNAAFGQALTYAWGVRINSSSIVDSSVAADVQSQIDRKLQDNSGLWLVQQNSADLIVVASETASDQSSGPDNLTIEVYDARTGKSVWQAVAINVLHKGESQPNNQVVDSAIGEMFKSFPYSVSPWVYATP